MPSIDITKEVVPNEADFWGDVLFALTRIYRQEPNKAWATIEQRRVKLLDADPLERALVMHENPVFIAAGLIGKQASEAEIRSFLKLMEESRVPAGA
jgi:hypothetical protein